MKLTGVEETTLIPLWARAYETTRKGEHLIEDPTAAELINKIDYDNVIIRQDNQLILRHQINKS